MRTLTNQTTSIVLDFPRGWNPANLTSITIGIADTEGNQLLPDPYVDDVTLYVEAALNSDSLRYSNSIELESGSDDLEVGDLIRISGILGYEDHVVKGYDADNLTAVLEGFVDRDFEEGATVNRLHGIYSCDLSDTATFQPGIQMVLTWTPTGTGDIVTEMAEIEETFQVDVAAFTKKFKAEYSRAYDALIKPSDRLDIIIESAQEELRTDLIDRNLDLSRIKDQKRITPPLMALVAVKWALGGDEGTSDELEKYEKAYSAAFEKLCRNPGFVDLDGDGTQDTGEDVSYPLYFERIW